MNTATLTAQITAFATSPYVWGVAIVLALVLMKLSLVKRVAVQAIVGSVALELLATVTTPQYQFGRGYVAYLIVSAVLALVLGLLVNLVRRSR